MSSILLRLAVTPTNSENQYEMIDELCDILSDFKKIMHSYKVDAYKAYATSAMREASNNMQVLDQIKVRAGMI